MMADRNAAAQTTTEAGRFERTAPGVAWGLAVLYVALFGLLLWMDSRLFATYFPDMGSLSWLGLHGIWLGPFVVFAVVGAVIASKRPRHPIGWLMLASALASALGEVARTSAAVAIGTSPDPSTLALWVKAPAEPITVSGLVLGLVLIPLLFPAGRLPSRRWRAVPWTAGLFLGAFLLNSVLSPRLTHSMTVPGREGQVQLYDVANPLSPAALQDVASAVPTGATTVLLPVLIIAAGVAVIVRFRGSGGIERQQMKWFVYAATLVALAAVVQAALAMAGAGGGVRPLGMLLLVAGLSAYPVAIGVAVLRYRLYEVDRIISRTVSYGLVIAVLAGVYVAGVVGLGAAVTALTGQGDSDLVVAASTLAAAGLFRPVRSRMQTAVDRRFNRTGYEARRAVEAFTRDVRDEVDLDRIHEQLAETAAVATQPSHVSVWLPDQGEGPV